MKLAAPLLLMIVAGVVAVVVPAAAVPGGSGRSSLSAMLSDLAEGGRKVCPYCHYCRYQHYCDGNCWAAECAACSYRFHCSSTCQGLCLQPETTPPPTPTPTPTPPACESLAIEGSCETYQCLELGSSCGSSGYLMGYGYKYCNRFHEHMEQFNSAGQSMVSCTRRCLTSALNTWSGANSGASCDAVAEYAFRSHVPCYLDCGFCSAINPGTTSRAGRCQNLGAFWDTFELWDFASVDALKQVIGIMNSCGWTDNVYNVIVNCGLGTAYDSITNIISDALSNIGLGE